MPWGEGTHGHRPRRAASPAARAGRDPSQLRRDGRPHGLPVRAGGGRSARGGAPATPGPAPAEPTTTIAPRIVPRVSVPEQCIETAELADEVISRLNRNVRDEPLFLALRDYTPPRQ